MSGGILNRPVTGSCGDIRFPVPPNQFGTQQWQVEADHPRNGPKRADGGGDRRLIGPVFGLKVRRDRADTAAGCPSLSVLRLIDRIGVVGVSATRVV